ncbi:MAG: DUF2809 domain-containing protein [Brevundimonas sp.]
MRPDRPRRLLLVAVVLVVAAGLLASRASFDALGDVLYAAMACLVVLLVAPRTRRWVAGAVAGAWCFGVELAQLSPVPQELVDAVPVLRYLLGTTFAATDLLAYIAGVGAVVGLDLAYGRRAARRAIGPRAHGRAEQTLEPGRGETLVTHRPE